jgi:cytochrome c-type biogenesis protein
LFQLTVFFIPALGGLSMQEASSSVSVGRRASVVKAALFFVLGFTVVYTVAGAVVGFLAGRLSDMSSFYLWQRYLGIAGGIVILLLALRVAAQVRAPLVCKMPVLSGMSRRRGPASPLQMMVAGVAFATGCMTCFGAAIVVAMVVYVGLAGSALVGGLTLFLFSLGMGIPLVIGAMAMARVLPLLSRFERAVRWMGLASTLVMVGFAVLLLTGNYMALTEWVYRMMPGLASG